MYCEKCGFRIPEGANFCPGCGAPQTQQTPQCPFQHKKPVPKDRIYRLLAVAVAVIAVCMIIVIKIGNWFPEGSGDSAPETTDYDTYLSLGADSLDEKDYQQAEDYYLSAIDLEPRRVDAYRELAELYQQLSRDQDALALLEQGISATGSQQLQSLYDSWSVSEPVSLLSDKTTVQVGESTQAFFCLGEVRYNDDNNLVWSSADPDIVEISDNGVVTGISVGSSTITGQYGDLSAACEITVIEPTPQIDYAEGISYQNATFCISSGSGLAVFRDIVNGENDQLVEGWSETEAPNKMRDIDGCLENDISLAEVCSQSMQSGETPWIPIGSYEIGYYGVFDGNGYCIQGFYGRFETYQDCYAPEGDDVPGGAGLFAMNNGKIQNLALSGEIDSEIRRVGGLVGINHGVISHCIANVDIHAAEKYVGGIAGVNDGENDCYIEYCANYGDIECSYKASQNSSDETRAPKVGGITGGNWAVGYVNSCFNVGMVYVQDYIHVGGLVGKISNEDSIFRSWSPEYCCNGGAGLQLMSDQEWSVEEGQILDGDALAILDSGEWEQGATYPELITCPTPEDF